jgi:hypothetical protein
MRCGCFAKLGRWGEGRASESCACSAALPPACLAGATASDETGTPAQIGMPQRALAEALAEVRNRYKSYRGCSRTP